MDAHRRASDARDHEKGQNKMLDKKLDFMACTHCHLWSEIPEGFQETKHFGKCPQCGQGMLLERGIQPEDCGFTPEDEVTANLREKLERRP